MNYKQEMFLELVGITIVFILILAIIFSSTGCVQTVPHGKCIAANTCKRPERFEMIPASNGTFIPNWQPAGTYDCICEQ